MNEVALLRHMLATIAYRGGKTLRDAPADFATFQAPGAANTPIVLLAHMGDLIEWAQRYCQGEENSYRVAEPLAWPDEVARFYTALQGFDGYLASLDALPVPFDRLFQAPIADVLTHVGQMALLRRMAGSPVVGEAYRVAEIVPGRVGPDQASPGRAFAPGQGAIWRPRP